MAFCLQLNLLLFLLNLFVEVLGSFLNLVNDFAHSSSRLGLFAQMFSASL